MVAVLADKAGREDSSALHPIDRVIEARRLAGLVPNAAKEQKARLLDVLAILAQERRPVLDSRGKTAKVAVFPEIVQIFMETLEAEQLIESSLLGPRFQLRGPQNEAARREIAQRTYASIPDALRSFRGESGIKSYIFGIVGNQYQSWVRETAKNTSVVDLPEDDVLAGAALRSSLLLSKLEIGQAMADLAPKHREIVDLTFFKGLSAAEIRSKLDLTDGQYRNRRRQALKEIGELLEERGHGC